MASKSTFAAPAGATTGLQSYELEGASARRRKRRKTRVTTASAATEKSIMDDLNLFIPITKVDAEKRLVYGVATAELPDVSGELCDYASTKPLYQKWSANFEKVTDGKSLGNLRAMHGSVAAGKLVDIAFNDDAKKIEICGKVVDDGEWNKVLEGVYTGFSQGGKYIKRWPDPDNAKLTRYTAEPIEVSLVDNPCLPEATFSVIKADGSTELRKFKEQSWDSDALIKFAAEWTEGAVVPAAFARGVFKLQPILKAGDPLYAIIKDVKEGDQVGALIAKIAALAEDGDIQRVYVHKRLPGRTFKRKAEMEQALIEHDAAEAAKSAAGPVLQDLAAIQTALAKGDGGDAGADAGKTTTTAGAGDGATTVAKKDFTDDERKKLASEGKAMKDGSFPIENKDDLENAIKAYGRAKNKAAAKRHIIKRAKALGATDLLPEDWAGSTKGKGKESKKVAGDGDLKKDASLMSVSYLLQLIDAVSCAEDHAEMPAWGFDAARVELPKDLCDRFGAALVELGDIAVEMLDLVMASIKEEEANEAVANAALASDLQKLAGLAKAGARHSKADKERIAKAHDLLADLDPDCCPGAGADEDTEKLAKALSDEKAARSADRTAFEKQLGEIHAIVKAIAAQPLPMGTSSVRVVDKAHDYGHGAGGDMGNDELAELASRAVARARAITFTP